MKNDTVKFPARIPAYLYRKLEKNKEKTMRSINLQIVEALRKVYK